jgi:hypothetical protein
MPDQARREYGAAGFNPAFTRFIPELFARSGFRLGASEPWILPVLLLCLCRLVCPLDQRFSRGKRSCSIFLITHG